jgi:hypothetical protein
MLENHRGEISLMRALLPLLLAGALAVAQPRDAPPPDNGGLVVPEGYVLQVMGATDGRIAMPKDWFYSNQAPIQDFGSFQRQCLEVLEDLEEPSRKKQFHILYTAMWLKDMDIVAISTFGAPPEKWDAVANITKVMSEFILIGKNPGNSN